MEARILVVDDDREHAEATAESLLAEGYEIEISTSAMDALQRLGRGTFEVVLLDQVMPEMSGLDLLKRLRGLDQDIEVIFVTGYPSFETAIAALNAGAYDYVEKPFNLQILRAKIRKALEKQRFRREALELRKERGDRVGFEEIVGTSTAIRRILEQIELVAPTESTVLIHGESGTGKELVARAIHQRSRRRAGRFVAINCAALPESLLESELFGHRKGAFTGALQDRKGRFEYAAGGTMFLDEIGDMPLGLQARLLRAVENREVIPVGSNEPVRTDMRLIAATHRDLEAMVREGKFREDLYFRINVVRIDVPPLRERIEDIPLLLKTFLAEFSKAHGKEIVGMDDDVRDLLLRYRWPGNVREMRNAIESIVVLTMRDRITMNSVPPSLLLRMRESESAGIQAVAKGGSREEVEREMIRAALARTGGNRAGAAAELGIGERTLYRKIKEYGLE